MDTPLITWTTSVDPDQPAQSCSLHLRAYSVDLNHTTWVCKLIDQFTKGSLWASSAIFPWFHNKCSLPYFHQLCQKFVWQILVAGTEITKNKLRWRNTFASLVYWTFKQIFSLLNTIHLSANVRIEYLGLGCKNVHSTVQPVKKKLKRMCAVRFNVAIIT